MTLEPVAGALERGELRVALALALDVWRARPAPALAVAIESLGRATAHDPDDYATLAAKPLPQALTPATNHLRRLATRGPDPRFTALLHQLIEAPPFGPNAFWRQAFDLIAKAGDPRSITVLETFESRLEAVARPSAYVYAERRRQQTIATLREAFPRTPPLTAAESTTLARIVELVDALHRDTKTETRDGTALLAEIQAHPEDDRARSVYADWLQERGDPRGELIALQLAGEVGPRVRALIKAHGKQWAGALAPVIAESRMRYERGFLTAVVVKGRAVLLDGIVGATEWFSVEELAFSLMLAEKPVCATIVCDPIMRSLRAVHGLGTRPAEMIATSPVPLALTTLGVTDMGLDIDTIATCPGLPRLERVAITRPAWIGGLRTYSELLDTAVAQRLRAISITTGGTTIELRRDHTRVLSRLHLELAAVGRSPDTDRAMLEELAGLVETIAEVEVVSEKPIPPDVITSILGTFARVPRKLTVTEKMSR